MSSQRPTFHESWSRVRGLRPRLRPTVVVRRQRFRGERWWVLEEPGAGSFFRMDEPAWRFVGLLDGARTAEDALRAAEDRLGDDAPTQPEALQLLGQLYSANLLAANAPGDVEAVLRRQSKRRAREITGRLSNLLFVRIPLFNPDSLMTIAERWAGGVFSLPGVIVWLVLIGLGLAAVLGRIDQFSAEAGGVVAISNLPLLYLSFALIKLLHEVGHGVACKRFARVEGATASVRELGVMMLVFFPAPYVDATSSWGLTSRWRRIAVAAAGMYVELAVAALMALVWARTSTDSAIHALAHNAILVAGVSTIIFNANPLFRYDAYYMLSDLIGVPNLMGRARESLLYLWRRFVWGDRHARSPAHDRAEFMWLGAYGAASYVYRAFVYVAIILLVSSQLFFIGMLLALMAFFAWIVTPALKLLGFLFASPEIARVRPRAIVTTLALLGALIGLIGAIPMADSVRIEGVVAPARRAAIAMPTGGELQSILEDGAVVSAASGRTLAVARNEELEASLSATRSRLERLRIQRRLVIREDVAAAQALSEAIAALEQREARLSEDLAALTIVAPFDGVWLAPDADRTLGAWRAEGETIGELIDMNALEVRAVAEQRVAPALEAEGARRVQLRVEGRPDVTFGGVIQTVSPAGVEALPDASLGRGGGGAIDTQDEQGRRTREPVFQVRIDPDQHDPRTPALRVGQRVLVRVALSPKPLAAQWGRALAQALQGRLTF